MKLSDSDIERFFAKTYRDEYGTLRWSGYKDKTRGYGRMQVNGRKTYAHRIAWAIEHGDIPDGYTVLHKPGIEKDVVDTRFLDLMPDRKFREFSDAELAAIRSDPRTNAEIAAEIGVDPSTISMIRSRHYVKSEDAYTIAEVTRLLNNYADIRAAIEYSTDRDLQQLAPLSRPAKEIEPKLFARTAHAKANHSKGKPSRRESLHCAILDLEDALGRVSPQDFALVYRVCLAQTHDRADVAHEYHCTTEGLNSKIRDVARRLAKIMNAP